MFLDIAKAYDSVFHVLLSCKLEKMLGHNTLKKWFKFYLFNKPQTVKINESVIQK